MEKKLNKIILELKSLLVKNKNLTHGIKRAIRKLLIEYEIYEVHKQSNYNKKKTYCSEKVQIGGGKNLLEGFLNIDIVPPADIIYDIREGIPLPDKSVNMIFSEHFLEHIDYPVSVKRFISECYRVLRNKGIIILGVPDLDFIVTNFQKKNMKTFEEMKKRWYSKRGKEFSLLVYSDLLNYNLRDQDDSTKFSPHLWAYDYEKLENLFCSAGFKKIQKWSPCLSLANSKRIWGSLYIEVTK